MVAHDWEGKKSSVGLLFSMFFSTWIRNVPIGGMFCTQHTKHRTDHRLYHPYKLINYFFLVYRKNEFCTG